MSVEERTLAFVEGWRPTGAKKPRKTRPTHISVVVCRRCLGAKRVLFQWFGEQECPECNGTGEFDE